MRLFFSLTSNQKSAAVKHCIDTVLRDLISGSLCVDVNDSQSLELAEVINDAMLYISSMETVEQKIDYIMGKDLIRMALQELGTGLAHQTIYLDDEENTMYLNELVEPERILTTSTEITRVDENDDAEDDGLDDEFFDTTNNTVKKNPWGVN
jgi:hypothetical protein